MSSGVSGYAAISARVRAKYSNLLSSSDVGVLMEAPSTAALAEAIKKTPYGAATASSQAELASISELVGVLRRHQAAEALSVIRAAPGDARPVLVALHRRHEVNNIKAVLRALSAVAVTQAAPGVWARVEHLLFPLGEFSSLPLEKMTEAGGIGPAVDLLQGTRYHEPLAAGLGRYTSEQSLFPLEVALDLSYWRGLWQETQKLAGENRLQAVRVVGSLIDANNLIWAVRYKVYKNLSEEELINYTLGIGYRVRDTDIRSIAVGANSGAVIARLYPEVGSAGALADEELKDDLPGIEARLRRVMARQCMSAFLGNPFHVGLGLAFLVLHDLEVQDLITLVEAKAAELQPQEYRSFLAGVPQPA